MRGMIVCLQQRRKWFVLIVCIAVGAVLLGYGQAAATGVKRGLSVCGQLLIPSLFPFMILSDFVIRSGLADGIGRRLDRVMRMLCGFSGCAAAAIVISMLGGYPAGALAVDRLLERGELDTATAKRLLRCCVNGGPAFIIGGIGIGMLGSSQAGVWLLAAHWLASLIILLIEREAPRPVPVVSHPAPKTSVAVAQSVHAASSALLSMCGFVLAASAVLSLTDAFGGASVVRSIGRCAFTCLLEVTSGCMEAATLGALAPFWIGAALGFGGLSVHGQIAAVTAQHDLLDRRFFRTRLLHALLGGCLSFLFFRWFSPLPVALTASTATLSSVTEQNDAVSLAAVAAMLLLCVIFLQTLPRKDR